MSLAGQSSHEWATQRTGRLPPRWAGALMRDWHQRRHQAAQLATESGDWRHAVWGEASANRALLAITERLESTRLPLDASDADICQAADQLAQRLAELAQVFHQAEALRLAMARLVAGQGLKPPGPNVEDGPAMARMTDPQWLRRGLRRHHAQAVEGAAIHLGHVHRHADPYVSRESLVRRIQQNERNAATLEATTARNELGQEYTLAELAAKGPANKAIRRAELMTRIAGFERIAFDLGHEGLFFTITCPSRMHKWRQVSAHKVLPNPRYDGTLPDQAQKYLAQVWARIRASLARQGIALYGFRIAEPNHDGTPHWHLLTFHERHQLQAIQATVWRYALADSPDEPGAAKHRVDFKPIDRSRGSAAGYIAKYVAKNIDGYGIERDLLGNDALTTAARVEAWASTWRIRQFQQLGGPPVTVWRELRRVASVPAGAPAHLVAAHQAVNKVANQEGSDRQAAAWDKYCRAQGGVHCGRNYRIRMAMREVPGVGRYGDPLGLRPFGVEAYARETYTPPHMAHMGGIAQRLVLWVVESSRHVWEIVSRTARAAIGRVSIGTASPAPWTRVNNCTEGNCNGHVPDEREGGGVPRGVCQREPADSWPGGPLRDAPPGADGRHGPAPGAAGRAG